MLQEFAENIFCESRWFPMDVPYFPWIQWESIQKLGWPYELWGYSLKFRPKK